LNPKPQQVIQSLKRLDCSLVSNKNLSKILPSSSLGPGPDEVLLGQIRPAKPFHPACENILSIVIKQCIYEKSADLVGCDTSKKNTLHKIVQPSNCYVIACVALRQQSLETSALDV